MPTMYITKYEKLGKHPRSHFGSESGGSTVWNSRNQTLTGLTMSCKVYLLLLMSTVS